MSLWLLWLRAQFIEEKRESLYCRTCKNTFCLRNDNQTRFEKIVGRKIAIKNAARSVFVFTKSKQNKKEMYTVCKAEEVYKVIM